MRSKNNGNYIKIDRGIMKNPVVTKDPEHLYLWMYLLTEACWKEHETLLGGKKLVLQPGQLIFGRKKASLETGISESKIRRILDLFKSDHQIEQQSTNQGSVITIVNWDLYQRSDQRKSQRATNERPASDQQPTTTEEYIRKSKKEEEGEEYINIATEHIDANFKHTYGTFGNVTLTDKEKEKLIERFGHQDTMDAIEYLDAYMQGGKTYKSCYQAMYTWVITAVREKRNREGNAKPKSSSGMTYTEIAEEFMRQKGEAPF